MDACSPREIAQLIYDTGARKVQLSFLQLMMLGFLAGAFIGLCALYGIRGQLQRRYRPCAVVFLSGHTDMNGGAIGRTCLQTAAAGSA